MLWLGVALGSQIQWGVLFRAATQSVAMAALGCRVALCSDAGVLTQTSSCRSTEEGLFAQNLQHLRLEFSATKTDIALYSIVRTLAHQNATFLKDYIGFLPVRI